MTTEEVKDQLGDRLAAILEGETGGRNKLVKSAMRAP